MIRTQFLAVVRAAAIAFSCLTAAAAGAPANAQVAVGVGFNAFHDRLAARGVWLQNARWGAVWRPGGVSAEFRPYFDHGHWVYTADHGWFWASDDDWGDVVYHYGRWVYDPDQGWIWIPGYTWGPGWVVWRWGGGYGGWMPAPPDAAFISAGGFSVSFGLWDTNFYGYRGWYGDRVGPANLWVFVGGGHIGDLDYRPFLVQRERVVDIIRVTRNVTEYRVVHGEVVNRSFGVREVQRLGGHPVVAASARTVMHGSVPITKVDEGKRIALQEHAQHPIPASATVGKHEATTAHPTAAATSHAVSATHHATAHHVSSSHVSTHTHHVSASHGSTHTHHASSVNVYRGSTVHHATTSHPVTHHYSTSHGSSSTVHAMSHGGSPTPRAPSGHSTPPAPGKAQGNKPH